MKKHKYTLFNGRWGISILICGKIFNKNYFEEDCIVVRDGIWLSFNRHPLIGNEIFANEDKDSILRGIGNVSDKILLQSEFHDRTVIQICSLQYSLCYYQEDAMVVAMMNWCAKVFNFRFNEIESNFDYKNNKYIFKI